MKAFCSYCLQQGFGGSFDLRDGLVRQAKVVTKPKPEVTRRPALNELRLVFYLLELEEVIKKAIE